MQKYLAFLQSQVKSNTYVHFLLLGIVFAFLQVLGMFDLVDVSFMRAIGGLLINAIVVLGFYILLGYAGLASLGTAGFVGLGTYLTGYLLEVAGWSTPVVLVVTILVGIILGISVGFISLRIEGMYLAIITLGLSEILVELFKNLTDFTNGVNGLLISTPTLFGIIDLNRTNAFFLIVIVFVVLLFLTKNITNSPLGRAMLTMKNSESAAQSMGISLLKFRLFAFVIATVFAMIAGYLYMIYYKFSIPTSWNLAFSLNILAVVVIGGTKSIWGILSGAFLIFGMNDIVFQNIELFSNNPHIMVVINGALMILIVMFYPGGISQFFIQLSHKRKMKLVKKGVQHD